MRSKFQLVVHALIIVAMMLVFTGPSPTAAPRDAGGNVVAVTGGAQVAGGNRTAPEVITAGQPPEQSIANKTVFGKPIDQPNPIDKARMMERQRLLEAGQTAEAAALAQTGTDRVLVILVEFSGTDVFTWTAPITPTDPSTGSQWDPLGIADPGEYTGTVGDCSNIITQTQTFTYTGPLHNMIERPRSAADRSGDSIWSPDFDPQWFDDFMFGNGVVISYTRQDSSSVYESFVGQSVNEYFGDLSSGAYTVTGDVVGWVSVPHSTWYYDADQCPGARSGASTSRGVIPGAGNARTLVRDALDAVNAISDTISGFDWANYDQNGDGIIDRLWIVHAGFGEEDSTTLLNRDPVDSADPTRTTPVPEDFYGEAAVWSHSSAVTPPYSVTQNIAAGAYIIMPENGGIGVFAHEDAHNLGADDLYAYGNGETSAGFWALQADDWTGYPIGFEPPAPDPWHLDNWGWLEPKVITDVTQVYTVTLGQASYFDTNTAPGQVYRGAKIMLPNGEAPLALPPWQGSNYWWGCKADVANGRMTTKLPIALPSGAVTLTFDTAYGIETEWDFLWVQVSTDSGTTWNTLTNTNTTCTHDSGWIGGLYGFPTDLCGAGLGGFTDYNASFPDPDTETFDLSAYAGQNILLRLWYMTDWGTTYEGPFVDSVQIVGSSGVVFADDAESGDANWNYTAPWIRSNGSQPFTHNYYLQWRNTNSNGGYDSALGDPRWRYGPANTGLLVWYNNNFYTDNEVFNYLTDFPGFGPKGRMLVVDSHPDPYREPNMVAAGYDNEGGNVAHRSLMRDAPFTLQNTVDFTMTNSYPYTSTVFTSQYTGRPAASEFNDAFGYYPGAEFVSRGPGYSPLSYKWVTKQWDASAVVPAQDFYGVKAPGYVGTGAGQEEFRFDCASTNTGRLGCYWFGANTGLGYDGGTGNPGDIDAQFGWRADLIEEAPDHTWATVRVYNVVAAFTPSASSSMISKPITFTNESTGNPNRTYLWDFGDGVTSTLTSPTHVFTQAGTYNVTLTVTTPYGTDVSEHTILVPPKIYLPIISR